MNSGAGRDRGQFDQRLARSIERARRYPGFHYAVVSVDLGLPGDSVQPQDAEGVVSAAVQRLETCLRVTELPPTLRHGDVVLHLLQPQRSVHHRLPPLAVAGALGRPRELLSSRFPSHQPEGHRKVALFVLRR